MAARRHVVPRCGYAGVSMRGRGAIRSPFGSAAGVARRATPGDFGASAFEAEGIPDTHYNAGTRYPLPRRYPVPHRYPISATTPVPGTRYHADIRYPRYLVPTVSDVQNTSQNPIPGIDMADGDIAF